jgi:uncharacterized membrane protein
MKWPFIIAGVIICIVLIVVIIGYVLPVKHRSTVQVIVQATPEKVWQRLVTFQDYPKWRKDLKSVEVKSDIEWIETNNSNDKLPFKIVANEPSKRFVTQINSTDLPYGGNWEFDLVPQKNNTLVTIIENGEVYNPIFRFVSKYIIGHTASQKKYADYLEQSFK